MVPYRIYLSGGGMCAIAHVGALQELSLHFPLHAVKEWMGVSAGSLVSLCIAIGFTMEELIAFCVRFDFTQIQDTDSVPGWILHLGYDTGERLHRLVEACLHVKGLPSDFTFKDLHEKFSTSLRVIATDMNKGEAIVFHHTTTPDYRVADAVRASMTFPYYFQPFLCPVTGHYLMDGAIVSNYPLFILPREEHQRTLSLLLSVSMETHDRLEDVEMGQLLTRPIHISLHEKLKQELNHYPSDTIVISLGPINMLDFAFDDETKQQLLTKGQEAVQGFLSKRSSRMKRRASF